MMKNISEDKELQLSVVYFFIAAHKHVSNLHASRAWRVGV